MWLLGIEFVETRHAPQENRNKDMVFPRVAHCPNGGGGPLEKRSLWGTGAVGVRAQQGK